MGLLGGYESTGQYAGNGRGGGTTPGPNLPPVGSVTYQGITVYGLPSYSDLPEDNPSPLAQPDKSPAPDTKAKSAIPNTTPPKGSGSGSTAPTKGNNYFYTIAAKVRLPGNGENTSSVGFDGGHAFVTLMKVNTDTGEIQSSTLGYYGKGILNGVVWGRTFHGEIKGDSNTRADVIATSVISKDSYEAALAYVNEIGRYEAKGAASYNVYTYNCVDFVRGVLAAADITMPDCHAVGGYLSLPNNMYNSIEGRMRR